MLGKPCIEEVSRATVRAVAQSINRVRLDTDARSFHLPCGITMIPPPKDGVSRD